MTGKFHHSITDVPGILVGHAHHAEALTGCTVVLCPQGAVAGIDQRGGAPGTRETDLLHPVHLVEKVHAIVLAGGSAFGLDAASGVMRFLEERKIGFYVGVAHVPIVPAAILFDLDIGDPRIRPDATMGYQACLNATSPNTAQGNVGAGMGATVGKILGIKQAMKSGLGTASIKIGNGVVVGALVAVNALGDVVDPQNGQIIAGVRPLQMGPKRIGETERFANTMYVMRSLVGRSVLRFATRQNTVIGVVATNARLNKEQITRVAQMAQDGLAQTIRPAHTMLDGDTVFALATGERNADVNIVGAFAAQVMAEAILNAVRYAEPVAGLPTAATW
ncbi:P1 family peptidase [uncultured Thermanaerothrix sp.]|uniref:P1 family peptidase n=1 Tax=uncultured Thermanaerothrix sp. TaxID=1195149 RepID=UPI00262345F9|nr:P1 family peptidase [uncultured Thermanaerothrix sp.]